MNKILLPKKLSETYILRAETNGDDFFAEIVISYENNNFEIKPSQKGNLVFNSKSAIDQHKLMSEIISAAINFAESELNKSFSKTKN